VRRRCVQLPSSRESVKAHSISIEYRKGGRKPGSANEVGIRLTRSTPSNDRFVVADTRAHSSLVFTLEMCQCNAQTFAFESLSNKIDCTEHAKSNHQPSTYSDQAIRLLRKHSGVCVSIDILTLQLPITIYSN
jgi:hypothetical protein